MLKNGEYIELDRNNLVGMIGAAEIITFKCIPRDDDGNIRGEEYDIEISLDKDRKLFDHLTSSMQSSLHD